MKTGITVERVHAVLDSIMDPCTHRCGYAVSIVDMGLIRQVSVDGDAVRVEMTFTEVGCMFTHRIITSIEDGVRAAGAESVAIVPVWTPMWTEALMTEKGAKAFAAVRASYGRILDPGYLRSAPSRMDASTSSREADFIARC